VKTLLRIHKLLLYTTKTCVLALLLAAAAPAWAQFTVVTGTVVDPNGIPYSNGTVTVSLTTSGTPVFTATGQPYIPPAGPSGLNVSGQFTVRLADVTQLSPGGGTYSFTVTCGTGCVLPAGGKGAVKFTISGITISGASQDISAQLQAAAPALSTGTSTTFPTPATATFAGGIVTLTTAGLYPSPYIVGATISVAGCSASGDNSPPTFTIASGGSGTNALTYADASGAAGTGCVVSIVAGSVTPAFSAVTSGTNPNALLVSGSLAPTGGGTVTANAASGTTIAQTGVDINTLFQVTSLHLTAPLGVASGGTGITTAGLTGIPQVAAGVWSVSNTLPSGLTLTAPNIGAATGTSLSLSSPLTGANGGTGLNTSASTGIPSVAAGTWAVNTTPPAITLANGTTASTQAPGDNSTKLATTAYVAQNAATFPGGITQGQNLVGGPSGGLSAADLISVKAFQPASGDVGAALAAAQASAGGGNFQLGGITGQALGYANTLPSSLLASGSTKGGSLTFGQQTIYVDGPPSGTITSCSRTGQTVTLVISSLGTIAPPIAGSYIQVLGLSSGNCSPFNTSSAQTSSPQAWQVTASTATSISFLSTASGTITSTGDSGTWSQISYSDGFGSGPMTPGWIDPGKFGDWKGEGRGSATANSLNSSISFCNGPGAPVGLCNFGPPARKFRIASIAFSCTSAVCQPSGTNPLNVATITLVNDSGTSCGGDTSGCTAVATTNTASAPTGLTSSGTTCTALTTTNHGLFPLTSWVTISGASVGGYNGYWQVQTTADPTHFTFTCPGGPFATSGGAEVDPHPPDLYIGELSKWDVIIPATATEASTTVTLTSTYGNFPTAYAVGATILVQNCSVNGYNTATPTTITGGGAGTTQLTYTATSGLGAATGCVVNVVAGTSGSGLAYASINGNVTNELQLPPMPIRTIVNANPPTSSTQTVITVPVPAKAPWTCTGPGVPVASCTASAACVANCGNLVLGTPLVGLGGSVAGGENSLCVKSSCYATNQTASFGNKIINIGLDTQGSVDGLIGLQNMYMNEESGSDSTLIQSASLACADFHGQQQNGGPWNRWECLYPVATYCDFGTTGIEISEVPGFSSASLTEYNRSTVNLNGGCANPPTAAYVIDSANVRFSNMYGSRTGSKSTFDVFLIGQNSTANNFKCSNCQGGATPPGNGPSNAVFDISANSSTASGPATGDYGIEGSQVNGNGTNLSISDDVLNIFYPVAGNPNVSLYQADSTKGYGSCGLVTTIPELAGAYICRKAVVAITAGQLVCNDGTTAGQIVVCGAAPAAGTVVGVAFNTVPASAIGTSVIVQTAGKVTSIVDTAGSCTLNAIVIVGPTTGGRVTCGAFSAGTTMGTSITTGTITAGGSLTYDLTLR